MAPEALITFFSVALAVLALLPRERWLDLQIRLGRLDFVVICAGVLAVHVILFYPVLRELGIPSLGPWRWGFTADTASYLILGLTATYALARGASGHLRRRGVFNFLRLVQQLLNTRHYLQLSYLLSRHLSQLVRVQRNQYVLSQLRKRLDPSPHAWGLHHGDAQGGLRRRWRRGARRVGRMLPTYEDSEMAAHQALHLVLTSDHFVRDLARSDPHLGLRILACKPPQASEFQTKWLTALLDDVDSVLHFEVKNTQNLASANRYEYMPSNSLLFFYFAHVKTAEDLALWKPLGDYLIGQLDERYRSHDQDRFNQPLDDYNETEQWRSPEFIVLRLFEFMLSESLYQGIQWHMWLYYLPIFARKIERNLNPTAAVSLNDEWPTPYHFLLYIIVSILTDLIRGTRFVSADQVNIVLESTCFTHENGNIPKSAALALGQVAGIVFGGDNVGDRFKSYILDMLLGLVEDLRKHESLDDYARLAVEAIARGRIGVPSPEYRLTLERLLGSTDLMLRHSVGDEVLAKVDDLLLAKL